MKKMFFLLILSGCIASKPSNAIEELGEQVIKRKEGIEIKLIPIEEIKQIKDKK